jgi:ribosomal-protein-alanine N-acetyltransferase
MNISGSFQTLNLGQDDISSIVEMDQNYFPKPWSAEEWTELNPQHYSLYMWCDKKVKAFALFHRVDLDETIHLLKICLSPEFRGNGLSQRFWVRIVQEMRSLGAKTCYLEVEKSNQRAIGFYQKVGFEILREIRGYYSDGSSAVTMQVTL